MAAAQCLECVATVLKGTCEKPALYRYMLPQLVPLVLHVLGNDGEYIEYLEYALDILTFLTFFPDDIDESLWPALPLIYTAFDQWAFDFLAMMIPPLENFIGKAPQRFLMGTTEQGTKYIDLVMNMVAKTLSEDRATKSECRKALSLYMTILHCCYQGQPGVGNPIVDGYLTAINDVSLAKLAQEVTAEANNTTPTNPAAVVVPRTHHTRLSIYQVLGSALFYNPKLQLEELERRNATQTVFNQWIHDANTVMDRFLPRKLTVLGLASVWRLPTSSLPPSLVGPFLPGLVRQVVHLVLQAHEDAVVSNTQAAQEEAEEGDDPALRESPLDDDEDDEGFGEDEDVTNEVDEAYMEALHNFSSVRAASEGGTYMGGDLWDDDEDDLDDEENYSSPLDEVDQLLFVNDTLQAAFQREPEVYQQVQAVLTPETVAACQKLSALAEEQRKKKAQAK